MEYNPTYPYCVKFEDTLSESECGNIYDLYSRESDKEIYNLTNDNTVGVRNPEYLKKYSLKIKALVESKLNIVINPIYSGMINYVKGSILPKHIDNAAPYAMTVVIKQSDDIVNPLLFYRENNIERVTLTLGDGYFFKGDEIYHERPPIESDYLIMAYFGYSGICYNKRSII